MLKCRNEWCVVNLVSTSSFKIASIDLFQHHRVLDDVVEIPLPSAVNAANAKYLLSPFTPHWPLAMLVNKKPISSNYGNWESPISADFVVSKVRALAAPRACVILPC